MNRPGSGQVVAALTALLFLLGSATPGAAHATDDPRLPNVVNAPGAWSDDEWIDGPVAAVAVANRSEPSGAFEERTRLALFAVSALDGGAAWLRLPGHSLSEWGSVGGFTVSPDGRWIGWVRSPPRTRAGFAQRLAGWSVMDTTTGAIHRLDVPGHPRVRATMADLAFSGDSRHLVTGYAEPDRRKGARSRSHQLVAWDVERGTPVVLEEPGPYWLPSLGSAPTGVVWSRKQDVFRVDPRTGSRSTLTLPQDVVTASWGPDDASFAYIGRSSEKASGRRQLYAGRSVAEARGRAVDLPDGVRPSQLLGWRDPTHVVVGQHRSTVHVVDVVTGTVDVVDLTGQGDVMSTPRLAGALWQQPFLDPVEPVGTTDPRTWWRWAAGVLLVLLAAALILLWSRSNRRDQAHSVEVGAVATHPAASLRPLSTAATGLLMAMLDLEFNGYDLIPDPVGLLIAAVALGSLERVHRGFRIAAVAAWVAVVPSTAEWIGVEGSLLAVSLIVVLTVLEVATCTAIMDVRPDRAATAAVVRGLSAGLGGALVLLLAVPSVEAERGPGAVTFVVGLAALLVTVWFLVLLYRTAKDAVSYQPA